MAAVPDSLAAHTRMLEERLTGAAGAPQPVEAVLGLLDGGQFVNCCLGEPTTGAPAPAAPPAAPLGSQLPAGVPRCAAEVLTVSPRTAELVIRPEALPDTLTPGYPVALDFTDSSGTFHLFGYVDEVHPDPPHLVLCVQHALQVQLRRFVRVPVLIEPHRLEVEWVPGEWRAVAGEIVDLSIGGMGLLLAEPLPAEAHLRAEFELSGRFGRLCVGGWVVPPPGPAEARAWLRPGRRLAYRRGVRFDPLTADDLRRLQRALYHRQVELRRVSDSPLGRRPSLPLAQPAPEPSSTPDPRPRWKFWAR